MYFLSLGRILLQVKGESFQEEKRIGNLNMSCTDILYFFILFVICHGLIQIPLLTKVSESLDQRLKGMMYGPFKMLLQSTFLLSSSMKLTHEF